jgi:hypothetical protein
MTSSISFTLSDEDLEGFLPVLGHVHGIAVVLENPWGSAPQSLLILNEKDRTSLVQRLGHLSQKHLRLFASRVVEAPFANHGSLHDFQRTATKMGTSPSRGWSWPPAAPPVSVAPQATPISPRPRR